MPKPKKPLAKPKKRDQQTIYFHLDRDLLEAADARATKEDRSRNYILNQLLRKVLLP